MAKTEVYVEDDIYYYYKTGRRVPLPTLRKNMDKYEVVSAPSFPPVPGKEKRIMRADCKAQLQKAKKEAMADLKQKYNDSVKTINENSKIVERNCLQEYGLTARAPRGTSAKAVRKASRLAANNSAAPFGVLAPAPLMTLRPEGAGRRRRGGAKQPGALAALLSGLDARVNIK